MDATMQKEYCLSMANTIYQTFFFSLEKSQVLSWGGTDHTAMWYKDKPSLRMKLNGMVHKGFVIVSYDEGTDTFEVFLLDGQMNEIGHFPETYADELGTLIDEHIERPRGVTEAQYRAGIIREIIKA